VRLEVAMEKQGHLVFLQLPQLLILALVAVVHFGQTRLVLAALGSSSFVTHRSILPQL
jgi:hypothetical protein